MHSNGAAAALVLACLLIGTAVSAAERPTIGASIFCDTAENMGRYLRAAEAGNAE
jgi:hypothetical protein